MLYKTPEDFLSAIGKSGALIGLDPGTKTIGVAVSDERRSLASPLETIERLKFAQDAARLKSLMQGRTVAGFVIGMPVHMEGDAGRRAQSVRAFTRNLEQIIDLPALYWDERLSTVAVERAMIDADLSRAKRAARIDAHAAAFILQGAIDRLAVLAAQA